MPLLQRLKKLFFKNKEYQALYQQADEFHRSGNYEEAIKIYDKLITLIPKNAELYWQKTEALFFLEDREEDLLKVIDKAINFSKDSKYLNDDIIFAVKGDILFEVKKYDLAILAFNNRIKKHPLDPYNYYKISESLFKISEYEQALEYINKAIKLPPNTETKYLYWRFYACQAEILKELGKIEEALVACDNAIELGGAYSYHQKAVILDEIGKYSEAIICLNKGIMQYPLYDLEICVQLKAKILCKLNKYDEALETLRNNKNFDTPYSEILTEELIYILEKADKYEELLAEYDRLIMNDPANAKLYDRKGMLFEKLGRLDEAAEYYNKMIDVKRRNKEF
ncbi:tetratricopeptide repeat protein [Rickettsia endosymbiont of Polydrusus tereticollis]|uniref:tetratricopeptide repeat protein n=1 Tax=Rickettsia endosymbiont of Polydrusus tereticollis TaxID=3066251 RepID=UPI003132D7F4